MKLNKYRKIQLILIIGFFVGVILILFSVYMNPNPEFKIIEGKQITLSGMSGETSRNESILLIKPHNNPIDVLNVSGKLYERQEDGSLVALNKSFYDNLVLSIEHNVTEKTFVGTFDEGYVIVSSFNSDIFPVKKNIEMKLYFSYHFPDVAGCPCNRFFCEYVFVPNVRIGYIP